MLESKCKKCNKKFSYYPSNSTGIYCSRRCYHDHIDCSKKCKMCGNVFRNYKNKIYCSKKCSMKALNKYQKKESHGNWKGGKYMDSEGYIHIKSYNHPFRDSQNYIREHRLIMEDHISRYLFPTEVVHHKNGIVDDNRIENLELIQSRQHSSLHRLLKPHNRDCNGRFI